MDEPQQSRGEIALDDEPLVHVQAAPYDSVSVEAIRAKRRRRIILGGISLVALLGCLAALCQITGYSLRDLWTRGSPSELDKETVNTIVRRYVRDLEDKDQTIALLKSAIDRARSQADRGDADAQAAIDDARLTGDIEKLQTVLIAEAGKRETRLNEHSVSYIELCREIAEVAYLRGDIDEAKLRLDSILRFAPDDLDAINRMGHIHNLHGRFDDA